MCVMRMGSIIAAFNNYSAIAPVNIQRENEHLAVKANIKESGVMVTTIHEPPKIAGRMPAQVNNGNGGGPILAPTNGNLCALDDRAAETAKTGIWVALAAITMSFAALTSALVVHQGAGINWQPITLPPILFANTFVLLASSITLEIGRRQMLAYSRGIEKQNAAPMRWLLITLALGLLFL